MNLPKARHFILEPKVKRRNPVYSTEELRREGKGSKKKKNSSDSFYFLRKVVSWKWSLVIGDF